MFQTLKTKIINLNLPINIAFTKINVVEAL